MKRLLKLAWGFVVPHSEWLVLLAVASVAAYFYADARAVRADRAALQAEAQLICAGAGAEFASSVTWEKSTEGKEVVVAHARGAICQRQVRNLASFKAETDARTAEILAQAMRDHDSKASSDAARAARSADAARAASERMEKADAQIDSSNRVGPAWFDALNDVAGLRPPRR